MIAKLVSTGRGIEGMVAYTIHDKSGPGQRHPKTSERVAYAGTHGSPTPDIALTVRIMQGLVADAAILKSRAGVSARGKKLKSPYSHVVLSWHPADPPTSTEQGEAIAGALQTLGMADRMSIIVTHTDKRHYDIHVLTCRVHPDDGRAATMANGKLKLSDWSVQFEQDHGGIQIPNRVARQAARQAFSAAVAAEMEGWQPTPGASKTAAARDRRLARREAVSRVRATGQHTMPPMEDQRGAGRSDRDQIEKHEWATLYERQRAEGATTTVAEKRAARVRLSAKQSAQRTHLAEMRARGASAETRAAVDKIHEAPTAHQAPAIEAPSGRPTTRTRGAESPDRG